MSAAYEQTAPSPDDPSWRHVPRLLMMSVSMSMLKKRKLTKKDEDDLEKIVFAREEDILNNLLVAGVDESGSSENEERNDETNDVCLTELPSLDEASEDEKAQKKELQGSFWSKLQGADVKKRGECESGSEGPSASRKIAWTDPDDEVEAGQVLGKFQKMPKKTPHESSYKDYLESKFYSVYKKPKWAEAEKKKRKQQQLESKATGDGEFSDSQDEEEEEEIIRLAGTVKGTTKRLPKSFLEFKKCTNINQEFPRPAAYRSIQFHPKTTVAILATPKSVDLFKIASSDYSEERHIKEYLLKERIHDIVVTPDGQELILGTEFAAKSATTIDMVTGARSTFSLVKGNVTVGLRKLVMSPDGKKLACKGEDGLIHVLDTRTKEFVMEYKMNDEVEGLCFSADSGRLFTHGKGGLAFIWDVRSGKPYGRFYDEGTVTATQIQCSPNGQFVATGSDSGVVNLYKVEDLLMKSTTNTSTSATASPVKAFMNLTTGVTCIRFNNTSELLAMASSVKKEAVRMAHLASLSVYSNFPHNRVNSGLSCVCEVRFSPGSAYCALGGTSGNAYLFRMCHYTNY